MIKVPGKSHAELLAYARENRIMLLYLTENKKHRGMIAHDDYFEYNYRYIDNFVEKDEIRESWIREAEQFRTSDIMRNNIIKN